LRRKAFFRLQRRIISKEDEALLHEPLFRLSDEEIRTHTQSLPQEFEGWGSVQTYFIDMKNVAAEIPPRPQVTRLAQMRENWGVKFRSLPYRIGLTMPRFAV